MALTRQEIRNPYDGTVAGTVEIHDREGLERAIAAAARVFATTSTLPGYERQRVLRMVAEGIAASKEEFARLIAQEAGKPLKAARAEVDRAVLTFSVAAEESTRIPGEVLPLDVHPSAGNRWGIVRRFPVGPIAAITPFNFPLNLVAHKVAPAIAAGCPVVLKPAPQTPLTALRLRALVRDAGWPEDGFAVVPASNEDAAPLVEDDRLKVLSFTGSVPVGWELKRRSGKKKVILELGGNAGVIVHSDADLAYAAERCVMGGFIYAGQSCISVQRIYVHRPVFDQFLELLLAGVKKLKSGDPLDETTDVGPLIREADAVRAETWVREAEAGGAKVLAGGKRSGSMLKPTVLTGTKPEMKVNREEVFAPVVTVEPYDTFREAYGRVNDSAFGLQAGIFTNDLSATWAAFEQIEVGGLIVNDVPTFRVDPMPYGGVKDSGLGREGLRYAIEEMTEPRLLVITPRP